RWFLSPPETWRGDFRQLSEVAGMRLTILDGQGTALADSRDNVSQLNSFADRTEIRTARTQDWGSVEIDGERLALAFAVREPLAVVPANRNRRGPLLGFVRTEADLTPVTAAVVRWQMGVFGLASTAGLLGLIAVAWTSYRLAEPIETFVRAASAA